MGQKGRTWATARTTAATGTIAEHTPSPLFIGQKKVFVFFF